MLIAFTTSSYTYITFFSVVCVLTTFLNCCWLASAILVGSAVNFYAWREVLLERILAIAILTVHLLHRVPTVPERSGNWTWVLKILFFASGILKNQDTESVIFFPVTFVLNYWNCLCVSHKLNYLLFSYTICCLCIMFSH